MLESVSVLGMAVDCDMSHLFVASKGIHINQVYVELCHVLLLCPSEFIGWYQQAQTWLLLYDGVGI